MSIPNPYFKNVPGLGDLKMEQIIVDYVYPLLSVLKDNSGKRYLCMCFDTRGAQQWLVTPVSNSVLMALLKNEATLSSPFEDSHTKKFKVVLDYHTREETFQLLDASQISKEELPDPGEYLDSEPDEWTEYIRKLNPIGQKGRKTHSVIHYYGSSKGTSPISWGDFGGIPQQRRKAGRYIACVVR